MTPKELKGRFPYMFEQDPFGGLAFHRGWFEVLVQLCEDVDQCLGLSKRGFHWIQLKEKYGAARFQWEMDPISPETELEMDAQPEHEDGGEEDHLRRRIADLIASACAATRSICIACGQPGASHSFNGWSLVLCERHVREREMGRLGQLLLADHDDSTGQFPDAADTAT